MKKILKYTVAVLAVTGLVANAELINLTDPSLEAAFQTDTTTPVAGWYSWAGTGSAIDVSPGSYWAPAGMTNLDGEKAAYAAQTGEDSGGTFFQTIELDVGVTYRLTVGIGTSPWIGKNDGKFSLGFTVGNTQMAETTGVVAANTGAFTDYSVEFTPTTGTDYRVALRNQGYVPGTGADNSQSTILFDNVRLEVVPEPATLGLVAVFGGAVLFIRRRLMI